MSSQDGKINFNNNKKTANSSRTRLESYELSREILKEKNKKSKNIIINHRLLQSNSHKRSRLDFWQKSEENPNRQTAKG